MFLQNFFHFFDFLFIRNNNKTTGSNPFMGLSQDNSIQKMISWHVFSLPTTKRVLNGKIMLSAELWNKQGKFLINISTRFWSIQNRIAFSNQFSFNTVTIFLSNDFSSYFFSIELILLRISHFISCCYLDFFFL